MPVMCFLNMAKQHFGCGQTPQVAHVLIRSATFRTSSASLRAQQPSGPSEAPTEGSQSPWVQESTITFPC